MRVFLLFAHFSFIFAQQCGVHPEEDRATFADLDKPSNFVMPANRLIGGVETVPHSWPWTAQLMFNGRHRCGGALVDERFVLTAAHCFARSRDASMYSIHLGGHESGTGRAHKVTNISSHDLFNVAWPNSYDVAIIRIDPPANFTYKVRTICLPFLPAPTNQLCVVAGWGVISENGQKSSHLREIHIPIVPWTKCNSIRNYVGRVHLPSMICAGDTEGSLDSCQGDSGGPLMCSWNGHWEVQGLVSWGIGCGRPGHPGVYSSVYSALPWINFQMWKMKG